MRIDRRILAIAVIVFGCSVAVWVWAAFGSFSACAIGTSDAVQKTVAILDSTVDLGVKISITVVGAGAALLIGFKQGIDLTPWLKFLLVLSSALFGQSALAGVVWKLRIANSWMNNCLNLVAEPITQRWFYASLGFFIAGILIALALIFFVALSQETTRRGAP
jgi:hypothetical protein